MRLPVVDIQGKPVKTHQASEWVNGGVVATELRELHETACPEKVLRALLRHLELRPVIERAVAGADRIDFQTLKRPVDWVPDEEC